MKNETFSSQKGGGRWRRKVGVKRARVNEEAGGGRAAATKKHQLLDSKTVSQTERGKR